MGFIWNLANDIHAEVFRGEMYQWLQLTMECIKIKMD